MPWKIKLRPFAHLDCEAAFSQRSGGFGGQCHSFLCPLGESPDQTFLDSLQKCRSCTHTKVGDVPFLLVLNTTRWRKENRTFLFVASSHSRFSRLLACHAACLTQKTILLSRQSKSASKILGITKWNLSNAFLKMHVKPASAMKMWLAFNIFGRNSHSWQG